MAMRTCILKNIFILVSILQLSKCSPKEVNNRQGRFFFNQDPPPPPPGMFPPEGPPPPGMFPPEGPPPPGYPYPGGPPRPNGYSYYGSMIAPIMSEVGSFILGWVMQMFITSAVPHLPSPGRPMDYPYDYDRPPNPGPPGFQNLPESGLRLPFNPLIGPGPGPPPMNRPPGPRLPFERPGPPFQNEFDY